MTRQNWKTGQVTIRLAHEKRARAEKLAALMPKMSPNDFYASSVEAMIDLIDGTGDRQPALVVALRALVEEEKRAGKSKP